MFDGRHPLRRRAIAAFAAILASTVMMPSVVGAQSIDDQRREVERIVDVRGDPGRDPRKHIVTIVYEVVAKGEPVAGDDAADAAWFPIADVLTGKVEMAGDHGDIIRCWIRG